MAGKKVNIKLPAELADKYEVSNAPSGHFVDPDFGEVNLYELTAKQAQRMVNKGFKYLVPKKDKK
jgi:hypothetical protein